MNRSPYTPYASGTLQPGLSHRENRGNASSSRTSPEPDFGAASYASHRTAEQLEQGELPCHVAAKLLVPIVVIR